MARLILSLCLCFILVNTVLASQHCSSHDSGKADCLGDETEEEDESMLLQVNRAKTSSRSAKPWSGRPTDCKDDDDRWECHVDEDDVEGPTEEPMPLNCQKPCLREHLEAAGWSEDFQGRGTGICNGFCGEGKACCKFNDPLAPEECAAVDAENFMDEDGFLQHMKYRCVEPKRSTDGKSNYDRWKEDLWEKAMRLLKDGGINPKDVKFPMPQTIQLAANSGFTRYNGMAKASAYLQAGTVQEKADNYNVLQKSPQSCCLPNWKQKCPALGDSQYALQNQGLFDQMTYTTYPYMRVSGEADIEMALYCGAQYTDDPTQETAKNAAAMAETACNDMGDLCGGFSVGIDPECCGNPDVGGCTQVIFLNSDASSSQIEANPVSMKSGAYKVEYFTWIK